MTKTIETYLNTLTFQKPKFRKTRRQLARHGFINELTWNMDYAVLNCLNYLLEGSNTDLLDIMKDEDLNDVDQSRYDYLLEQLYPIPDTIDDLMELINREFTDKERLMSEELHELDLKSALSKKNKTTRFYSELPNILDEKILLDFLFNFFKPLLIMYKNYGRINLKSKIDTNMTHLYHINWMLERLQIIEKYKRISDITQLLTSWSKYQAYYWN